MALISPIKAFSTQKENSRPLIRSLYKYDYNSPNTRPLQTRASTLLNKCPVHIEDNNQLICFIPQITYDVENRKELLVEISAGFMTGVK
jgi:hypothetical protein